MAVASIPFDYYISRFLHTKEEGVREEEGRGGAEGGGRDVTSFVERIIIRNWESDVKPGNGIPIIC